MKPKIEQLIRDILIEIIPEMSDQEISPNDSFTELGANSVDRGELITLVLERLQLNVPRIEFAGAQTINELTDLITEKIAENEQ